MRQPIRAATISLFILLLLCGSLIASQAQNPHKNTIAKDESSSLAYSVRPVLLPPSVSAILLKSHLNLAYRGHVLLKGFALNDKGEAAFAIVSESKNALVGGVYTENRTVVSIGDIVSGKRIYDLSDVRINNQGQVSYRASDNLTHASDGVQGIFVEKSLVYPAGSIPIFSQYLLSETGQVYVFTGGVFDDGSVGFYGDEGTKGIIYRSQAIPSLALRNPYDTAATSDVSTPGDNVPNNNSAHIKSLPGDVIEKLATVIYRDPFVSKYQGGLYHWKRGAGGELEPSINLVGSINKSFRNTVFSSPSGGVYYDNSYNAWQGEAYKDFVAKGLRFSDTSGPHGYSVPSPAVNSKGQLLFKAIPTPQDTRIFVLALATPDNAPAPEPEMAIMRTDANRDGTITFDDADKSTPEHPYTFWLNNNSDVFMADEQEDEDQDPALAKPVDSGLPKIPNARDLEDFERLQIKLPSDFNADSGQWEVTLELASLSPASGTPTINIVPAPTTGMDYLTGSDDQEISNLLSSSKVEITASKGAATHGGKGTSLDLKTLHIQDGIIPLLFEGMTAGKGVLTVHVYKSGTEVAKDQTYLNLLPITKMYDHYTADPLENGLPWQDGGKTGDGGDSSSVKLEDILTEPKQVNLDETTHPTQDYVLFVHGWRMPRWERIAFAQTSFKRLWHLGYKGRFGFFSWPTEYTTTDIPTMAMNHANYDDSEWKAYISAQALHSLLTTLHQKYTVRVFAHSMGNVVTSEALRLEAKDQSPQKLVRTYVANQAAVAAQAYDVKAPTVTLHDPAPNVYAFYPTGSSSNGTPYFGAIGKASENLVNFFNPDDYALKNWRIDQSLKPDRGYTYVLNGQAQPYPNDHLPDGFYHGETPLVMPQNAYEIFAKAAPAYSLALGAQTGVGGPFATQVDLKKACGFTGDPNNHSAQFEDTFSKRQSYWELLLKAFGLGASVPN